MVRWLTCAATLLCLSAGLALLPLARAQQAPSPAAAGIDCQMLARMPNAPMTVQTCEQRMAAHLDMMSALEAPGGARPGDERMTCEAIAAELRTLKVSGVSAANAAEGQAARERLEIANTHSMADLVKAMRANPRFARLLKLGGERNCQG